jgi:hypothetical protein
VQRVDPHSVVGILQNLGCNYISGLYHSDRFFYAFLGLSIILNLLLTALIWSKLQTHRKVILRALEGSGAVDPYTSVITIVVESAAGWTVAALLYLVTLACGAWISDVFEYTFQIAVVSMNVPFCSGAVAYDACSNSAQPSSYIGSQSTSSTRRQMSSGRSKKSQRTRPAQWMCRGVATPSHKKTGIVELMPYTAYLSQC